MFDLNRQVYWATIEYESAKPCRCDRPMVIQPPTQIPKHGFERHAGRTLPSLRAIPPSKELTCPSQTNSTSSPPGREIEFLSWGHGPVKPTSVIWKVTLCDLILKAGSPCWKIAWISDTAHSLISQNGTWAETSVTLYRAIMLWRFENTVSSFADSGFARRQSVGWTRQSHAFTIWWELSWGGCMPVNQRSIFQQMLKLTSVCFNSDVNNQRSHQV